MTHGKKAYILTATLIWAKVGYKCLYSNMLNIHSMIILSSDFSNLHVVVCAYNYTTWELERWVSGAQGQLQLDMMLKDRPIHMRFSL